MQQMQIESIDFQRERISQKAGILAWAVFFTGVLYYCFAYLLRVYPSIMQPDLRSIFHIGAGGFGFLTSFYYFSYAPMQLPVGLSVDRIGPRRSLIVACLVTLTGAFIFATVQQYAIALVARFLVGLGAAFAYVTALKIASVWLPKRCFATAAGVLTGCGMFGAIFTDMFLTHMVSTVGYKHALYFPLEVGLVLFAVIFFVVRDKPKGLAVQEHEESHALGLKQLKDYLVLIVKNRQMWLIGLVGALLYMPASVFLDVWAIPYLQFVHHLTAEQAAMGVSVMLVGWLSSSFVSCAISDICGTRKIPLILACALGTVVSCVILYVHGLSAWSLYALLFSFGLCCGPHPLCFTLSKENNPHQISGTAVSFANFVIMMAGFIFQPVVGVILDLLWDGKVEHGIRVYSAYHYTLSMSILPLGLIIATVATLYIKETCNCSPR